MASAVQEIKSKLSSIPWGHLPPRMRVLFVTGSDRTGNWLANAFSADSASEVLLEEAFGVAEGLARLRDEIFDAVLIGHEGAELDALDVLDAIRAGSSDDQPIIVLGHQSEQELSDVCYEAGADAYVCVNAITTRTLIWKVARAMERHQLVAENRRLEAAQRHRLQLEQEEATRLLRQQRALVTGLDEIRSGNDSIESPFDEANACPDLPETLVSHYRELLRAFVIMGSGNFGEEMARLAQLLAAVNLTARQAMLLHLHVLEEMVSGLGSRSARHVMSRADLLILEMIINLSDDYRERLLDRVHPPRQLLLPGFNASPDARFAA